MTTISQILSNSGKKTIIKNTPTFEKAVFSGEQQSKRIESNIARIQKSELIQTYINDPLVFNSVNKYVQMIMSAGYSFEGSEKSVKGAKKFYDSIGSLGGEIDSDILLSETFKQQIITGNCWWENIYNKAETKLVDVDLINPSTIDYVRDFSGNVLLDDYGNPLGFTQTISDNVNIDQYYEVPENADVSNKLFLPPWKVTHFKLYTVGDNLDGIGLVEPVYNISNRKMNIEQGYANSARRLGYPIITANIGDSLHEPTEQQKLDVLEEIKNIDYRSSFAMPYYVKLDLLESKKPEKLSEHLNYFTESQVTGLGLPKAFASGSGEATNRSTLARQEYIMKLTLKEIIKKTIRVIKTKQLSVLAKQNNWSDIPNIVWNEVSLEELDGKADRLSNYAKNGLITPTKELEDYIKKIEGLP